MHDAKRLTYKSLMPLSPVFPSHSLIPGHFEVQTLKGDDIKGDIFPYTPLLLSLGSKYVPHLPTCVGARGIAQQLSEECPELRRVLIGSTFFTKNPPDFDAFRSMPHRVLFRTKGDGTFLSYP